MLNFFKTKPIIIRRLTDTGEEDSYGNPKTTVEDITVQGLLGFRATYEKNNEYGSSLVDEYKLILDTPMTLKDTDIFIVDDVEWIVDGNPIESLNDVFANSIISIGQIINVKRVERA